MFLEGPYVDPHYQARREPAFIIAVNCAQAAATCFCTSMKTGPKAVRGFDLALTELADVFLVEVATDRGRDIMADVPCREADGDGLGAADRVVRDTESQIKRRLDTSDLPELLYNNLEHPRWDDVADRCLSCTNCTMVCPTCFCHSIEDVPDLDGQRSERVRLWDSCFNLDHAHTAGGNMRPDIRSRYRQWLTHKLASWIDQYRGLGMRGLRALHHLVPRGDRHHRGSGRHPRRNDVMMTRDIPISRWQRSDARDDPPDDSLCPHPANVLSVQTGGPEVATFSLEFQDQERQSALPRPAGSIQHDLRARGRRGADLGLERSRRRAGNRPHDPLHRPGHRRDRQAGARARSWACAGLTVEAGRSSRCAAATSCW